MSPSHGYFLPFFSFFGASFFFGVAFLVAHPFVPQAMVPHPLLQTILCKTVFPVNNNVRLCGNYFFHSRDLFLQCVLHAHL